MGGVASQAPISQLANLGNPVTTRQFSWMEMSIRAWGSEWAAPDHGAYEFSNGRRFDSTDQGFTGLYGNGYDNFLMIDTNYPDMASNNHVLQDNYGRILLGNV
jgi:hypothetical protein